MKFVLFTVRKLKKTDYVKEKHKFFVPEKRNTNKYCKIINHKLVKILVRSIGFSSRKKIAIIVFENFESWKLIKKKTEKCNILKKLEKPNHFELYKSS